MTFFIIGFTLSATIAIAAYYKRALNTSGAMSAIITGTLVFGFGGFFPYLIFISFFALSSGIQFFTDTKQTAQRSYRQVLANGLIAVLFITLYYLEGETIYYALFIGSVAVSAADTASSEVGILSKRSPVSIFTFRRMEKGLSGAITPLGLVAGLLTALFYALLSLIPLGLSFFIPILITGFLGTLIDSALGTVQVKYKHKKTISEEKSENATHYAGFRWLDNDLVNFLTNAIAVSVMFIIWII